MSEMTMSTSSPSDSSKVERMRAGALLALAGVSVLVSGALHPKPEGATVSEAEIGMLQSEGWVVAHLPQAFGMGILVVALILLRRDGGLPERLRTALGIALAGACIALVESVPHILAANEVEQIIAADTAPMSTAHSWIQAFATPTLGFGIAATAIIGARTRALGSPALAVLGVIGGVGFGFAGPSVLFTESMLLARLFMTTAAMALWMVGAGVLLRRRTSKGALATTGAVDGARVGQHAGT